MDGLWILQDKLIASKQLTGFLCADKDSFLTKQDQLQCIHAAILFDLVTRGSTQFYTWWMNAVLVTKIKHKEDK